MHGPLARLLLAALLLLSAASAATAQQATKMSPPVGIQAVAMAETLTGKPALAAEQARQRLAASLADMAYVFSAYLLGRDHVRSLLEDEQACRSWQQGVYPGTERPAASWMVERMRRLVAGRSKIAVADRLWQRGGEPMLALTLKAIEEMRLEYAAQPAVTAMR